MIRGDALPVERIDPADSAKIVRGRARVELIAAEHFFAGNQSEPTFVDYDHQGVLAAADRTVACGQFRKIDGDFEANCAAVAATRVFFQGTVIHGVADFFVWMRRLQEEQLLA